LLTLPLFFCILSAPPGAGLHGTFIQHWAMLGDAYRMHGRTSKGWPDL
jgi:hypothetical protein